MLLICKTDFRDVKIRMCLKNRCKITHFLSNPKKGKAKKCCKPSFFLPQIKEGMIPHPLILIISLKLRFRSI